jgi:type IV pilus assembly protein PilN
LRQQSARLDEDIARAEAEAQQLRGVLAEVQKFEARKAQLQSRVTIIEKLRKGQTAPVRVLDAISRSLPDRLWLTELRQTGGVFAISGYATSLGALSDFVTNLETSKWFKKPVELVDSQVERDAKNGDFVKFSIKANVNDPDAASPARPGTARGSR